MAEDPEDQLTPAAIEYHRYPIPGKIAVTPTKRGLSLAYSPGVAAARRRSTGTRRRPANLTSRANLVAVVKQRDGGSESRQHRQSAWFAGIEGAFLALRRAAGEILFDNARSLVDQTNFHAVGSRYRIGHALMVPPDSMNDCKSRSASPRARGGRVRHRSRCCRILRCCSSLAASNAC